MVTLVPQWYFLHFLTYLNRTSVFILRGGVMPHLTLYLFGVTARCAIRTPGWKTQLIYHDIDNTRSMSHVLIYRSILVWPILKPAPKIFCSVESKTKLQFFIVIILCPFADMKSLMPLLQAIT